jgi:hypothetical protein
MNDSVNIFIFASHAVRQRACILASARHHGHFRRITAAKVCTAFARLVFLAVALIGLYSPVFAEPRIEVGFEAGAGDSQKLVHAQAVFPARQSVVYNIFDGITAYPKLHDWIRNTTLVSAGKDSQQFLVKFAFPWPVGRQWSRVEVRHEGNTIFWRQVEGSLKANHGRISFGTVGGDVHIDYRAAIDIGLPELVTQSYKEKFIREFLTAACDRAEQLSSPAPLVVAVGQ